jgi:hypothetical protein
LPSAVATGAFYVGLGIFSESYFSSTINADSRTHGSRSCSHRPLEPSQAT